MPSAFSWPMSVPSALRAPAPVNLGVRRLKEKIVFIVFLGFIANQSAASTLFFPIVWLVMRKRGGMKLGIGWLVPGIIATAFVGGLARFAFWMVSGERAGAPIRGDAGSFFYLVLPILTARGLCALLKWQMRRKILRPTASRLRSAG